MVRGSARSLDGRDPESVRPACGLSGRIRRESQCEARGCSWLRLSVDLFQQFTCRPEQGAKNGKLRQLEPEQYDAESFIEKKLRSRLILRPVVDPEQKDAHLVEPEQPRQIRGNRFRQLQTRLIRGAFKKTNVQIAYR